MLITHQKFMSCILGHYIRSCHFITCNTHKTWYCMCNDFMHTLCGICMQASWPPYVYVAHQEVLMDVPFAQAEQYLSKITTSHFTTLNTDFVNWNVLKRILIAMLNENKADCNENFRICAKESVAPLYKQ